MTTVIFLSDTHSYLDEQLFEHFAACDEIWHAGDIGSLDIIDRIKSFDKTTRFVFGNVDNREIQYETDENLVFNVEGLTFLMTHIIGRPTAYSTRVKELIARFAPDVLLFGHSHQLLVKKDANGLVQINPGAAGKHGFHLVRTAFKLTIDNQKIVNFELLKLGKK